MQRDVVVADCEAEERLVPVPERFRPRPEPEQCDENRQNRNYREPRARQRVGRSVCSVSVFIADVVLELYELSRARRRLPEQIDGGAPGGARDEPGDVIPSVARSATRGISPVTNDRRFPR